MKLLSIISVCIFSFTIAGSSFAQSKNYLGFSYDQLDGFLRLSYGLPSQKLVDSIESKYLELASLRESHVQSYFIKSQNHLATYTQSIVTQQNTFNGNTGMVDFLEAFVASATNQEPTIRAMAADYINSNTTQSIIDNIKERYRLMKLLPPEAQRDFWLMEYNYKEKILAELNRFNKAFKYIKQANAQEGHIPWHFRYFWQNGYRDLLKNIKNYPAIFVDRDKWKADNTHNFLYIPLRLKFDKSCYKDYRDIASLVQDFLTVEVSSEDSIRLAGQYLSQSTSLTKILLEQQDIQIKCKRVRNRNNVETFWDTEKKQLIVSYHYNGRLCGDPYGHCGDRRTISNEIKIK